MRIPGVDGTSTKVNIFLKYVFVFLCPLQSQESYYLEQHWQVWKELHLSKINEKTVKLCLPVFSTLESTGSCLPDLLQWTLALTSAVNTHCPFHGDSLARWDSVLAAAVYLAALTKLLGLLGQHNAMLAATAIWFGISPLKSGVFPKNFKAKENESVSPNRIRTEQPLHVHAGEGKMSSGGNPNAVFFIFFYVLKFIDLEFLRNIKMEFQKT